MAVCCAGAGAWADLSARRRVLVGQNLTVEWRVYGADLDLIPGFVADLINTHIDVLYVSGNSGIRAAQRATTTIPILGATKDMVGSGLVGSLARPGGNTTGVSILATELNGKRQEILIEAVPQLRRMAILADSKATGLAELQVLQDAARARH
jgi:putative ABC transport system substrate-binding protein